MSATTSPAPPAPRAPSRGRPAPRDRRDRPAALRRYLGRRPSSCGRGHQTSPGFSSLACQPSACSRNRLRTSVTSLHVAGGEALQIVEIDRSIAYGGSNVPATGACAVYVASRHARRVDASQMECARTETPVASLDQALWRHWRGNATPSSNGGGDLSGSPTG